MKSKKLVVLFLALATAAMSFVAIYNAEDIVGVNSVPRNTVLEGYYSLDLSPLTTTNKKINTTNQNEIQFNVDGFNSLTFQSNGYISNISTISGIHSLTINFVTNDIDLNVSYGWAKNDYDVTDGIINSSSQTYTFNNEAPSFFKIVNNSGSAVHISSIDVEYSCHETDLPSKYALTFTEYSSLYYVTSCKRHAKNVVIPEIYNGKPVVGIKENSFASHYNLMSLSIPKSVVEISDSSLRDCTSLSSITVHEDNPYYFALNGILYKNIADEQTLVCCPSGKTGNIIIDNSTNYIGNNAFGSCHLITSVTIPTTVSSIGECAFIDCCSLESIVIPSGVSTIEAYTFDGCNSLISITIPDTVVSILDDAFFGCSSLKSLTIPGSVETIGYEAFGNCSELDSLTIKNGVVSIDVDAFIGCSSLSSVIIPHSVTSIGSYAFGACSSLISIFIPNSVANIGPSAFINCSLLTIYCEAESRPSGWDTAWNSQGRPVVWGYSA